MRLFTSSWSVLYDMQEIMKPLCISIINCFCSFSSEILLWIFAKVNRIQSSLTEQRSTIIHSCNSPLMYRENVSFLFQRTHLFFSNGLTLLMDVKNVLFCTFQGIVAFFKKYFYNRKMTSSSKWIYCISNNKNWPFPGHSLIMSPS